MSNRSKMGVELQSSELKLTQLNVSLPAWIVQDLEQMSKTTQRPLDELIQTSLMMFIATHNDYLGKNKNNQ
ncbi:hypothetical protein EBQ90_07410 [bacterium]|nr:hypothetical protein [bacterium]